jgi:LysM repeat protein
MSYQTQAGDTFSSVAAKLNVQLGALEAVNPGVDPNDLQIGSFLNTVYTIESGDTLNAISSTLGCSLAQLEAANPNTDPNDLQIGATLNLPSGNGTGNGIGGGYVAYSGPASNFPDPSTWVSFDALWQYNMGLMANNGDDSYQIELVKQSILTAASESGVDPRCILCIIMQESGGWVLVPATNNGVRNPGIMQSHDGVAFDPSDQKGSILQMVRDGTEGTYNDSSDPGPGLQQLLHQYQNYYKSFRAYNSGRVNENNLSDGLGSTDSYVADVANRLQGHVF